MIPENNPKRLYKSRQNRMIGGVCGGVAEYFDIDPSIVRILWVLSIFLGGAGVLLYIVAMIVVPPNPSQQMTAGNSADTVKFWGLLLVGIGVALLLDNLDVFPSFPWWKILSLKFAVSLLLITVGLLFIVSYLGRPSNVGLPEASPAASAGHEGRRQLHRSTRDRKLLGVCGGIAEYFDIDSTIVRLLFIVLALSSFGVAILAYVVLALVLAEERLGTTSA